MQVEISPETEERLLHLVECGRFDSIEQAVEEAVLAVSENDEEYEEMLSRKLDRSRASARAGRHQLLTRELAEEISREGRARLKTNAG